jgi:hypothetical protein
MQELTIPYLQREFNESSNFLRVLSILSPTCTGCLCGYGSVREIFEKINSEQLKGFLIWLPMLIQDSLASAAWQQRVWTDKRVVHGWDYNRKIGHLFARTMRLNAAAWDVYLVYSKGIMWNNTDEPPKPTIWMHQLSVDTGADPCLCLKPMELFGKIQNLLREA